MKIREKLGLGTVQFGLPYGISNKKGQTPPDEVAKILNAAFSNGIRIIDTASAYGSSEAVIGMLHNNRFLLVSKFLPPQEHGSVDVQLDQSLNLLKTDWLYGYLAHRPLDLLQDPKVWETLQALKNSKRIQKIGFSLNSPQEYEALAQCGITPDLVQVPYNYFDTRFKKILIKLKSNGCEIHTRSAFLQGLFFTDLEKLPPFFDALKPKLQDLKVRYKKSLHSGLLKYVLVQDFIDVVIMGVETTAQLENNINSLTNAPDMADVEVVYSDELLMPLHWPQN